MIHQLLGAVHQAALGGGVEAGPLQDWPQADIGTHQGQEQVLGQQLGVLALDGPLPGGHQGAVGFLGKGQLGHGNPPDPKVVSNMMCVN